MKNLQYAIGLILALVFSLVLAWSAVKLWHLLAYVAKGATTLEPSVYVPLTVTILTAILGRTATLFSQSKIRNREIEAAHCERKLEIYLDFLKTYEALFLAQKKVLNQPEPDTNELALARIKFRTKATLWGSPGVLKALHSITSAGDGNIAATLKGLEALQREMRKDLGLSNRGLEDDLLSNR